MICESVELTNFSSNICHACLKYNLRSKRIPILKYGCPKLTPFCSDNKRQMPRMGGKIVTDVPKPSANSNSDRSKNPPHKKTDKKPNDPCWDCSKRVGRTVMHTNKHCNLQRRPNLRTERPRNYRNHDRGYKPHKCANKKRYSSCSKTKMRHENPLVS